MHNPVFDRRHIREYFLYGSIAALLYMIPICLFLENNSFGNLYYLFTGNCLFMFSIFLYAYKLVYRPYEQKRAVSMLIAGNLASITGVVISVILVLVAVLMFFPHLFRPEPANDILTNSPASMHPDKPAGLLFMILLVTVIGNIAVGFFISVITAYAGRNKKVGSDPSFQNLRKTEL